MYFLNSACRGVVEMEEGVVRGQAGEEGGHFNTDLLRKGVEKSNCEQIILKYI